VNVSSRSIVRVIALMPEMREASWIAAALALGNQMQASPYFP
jgi:hypothetical protein